MSRPGSAPGRPPPRGGQPPAFVSQPGSATAAAAAAFAPQQRAGSGQAASRAHSSDPEGNGPAAGGVQAAYAGGYGAEAAAGGPAQGDPSAAAPQPADAVAGAAAAAGGDTAAAAAGGGADAAPAAAAAEGAGGAGEVGYSPAAYLQQLEAHLSALQQQRLGLEQQLATTAAAAYQHMSQQLGTASTGVPLPPDVPALVDELAVLQAVRQYLAYFQELQALTRHAEKAARSLRQQQQQAAGSAGAAGGGAVDPAFLQAVSEAVDGFSNTMSYAIAVRQLTEQGKVPIERLQQHACALLARVESVQGAIREVLSAAIQQRLAALHWPPRLTVSGEGGSAGPAAGGESDFRGFGAAGPEALAELLQLFVVLLTLQRAGQHERFSALAADSSQEGPLLWAAEELALPLAERLRHHFASGLPTDRPDRPEWLFATALKAAQQCAPLAQELQPCVDAHQLQAWYSLPLELARAVQAVGVNRIVADHLLPQLVAAGDPSLWLHYADEAMAFEKRFASLRGASLALPEDEEFLGAAHPGSCLELLFERPEWQEGWLGAELWDASRQLDAACDAFSAWQPAAEQLLAVAGQDPDLVPDTPRSRGGAAWRREFWPPVCAEQAASLVTGLVRRGGWVHNRAHKLQYSQAVPLAVLKAFRESLSGMLLQAEQFRGLLGDTWLPRVGASVCAAHFLEHHLTEPQGLMLLAELQDASSAAAAANGAADGDAGAGSPAAAAAGASKGAGSASGEGPAAGSSKGSDKGAGKGGPGRSLAALLEREAAAFGALRRQWAYKLAKQAVDKFHQLFGPYKRNAAAFTAGWEEGVPPEHQAAAAPGAAAPSPAMLLAADSLQQLLRALAQHLDAVAFRDVWKSVALAVNYSIYNEVATEALFSPQGAAQLDADLSSVSAVFGEYTSRPAAHFKESREACRLLALPHAAAEQLLGGLEAAPLSARELLAPHGVKALNAEQAAVVLLQRLDVLTARAGAGGGGRAAAAQAAHGLAAHGGARAAAVGV